MYKYYIVPFIIICSQIVNAQNPKFDIEIGRYKHTITFIDHKIVFQLIDTDQSFATIDPEKRYYWYSNNQIKITQGGFSGKLLSGTYDDFYTDNNLKEQGTFKLGLKVGEWKAWSTQGILIKRANYSDGNLDGPFFNYHPTGELAESGFYKKGKMNGRLTKYLGHDSLIVTRYKNGFVQIKTQNWLKKQLTKKSKSLSNTN